MLLSKEEIGKLSNSDRYKYFMNEAIAQAKKAEKLNEVPIGAVIVYNNEIIGTGYNLRESSQDATTHAELIAIKSANQYLGNWRLSDCELYVTLEPCSMCSGAVVLSRVKTVIYGASDFKAGACGTLLNLVQDKRLNHRCEIVKGIEEDKCRLLLRNFFKKIRENKK